ncbi:MAG TPA: hypothetical protein VGL01_00665 [Trinickia sp.]|uniref:hypothetical protein n=1 Tax=Trinickia sp. TaxID=2571163 RepID=UPI002F40381D
MLRPALFAMGVITLLCATGQAPAVASEAPAPTYWYNGDIKVPLYRQPQLHARGHRETAPRGAARIAAGRNLPPIYERAPQESAGSPSALTVYSTRADWRRGKLMVQAPGVVFTVADGQRAKRAEAWLAERGLRAKPIADGAAYKIDNVAGVQALNVANALYESKLVRHAQPNWMIDIDRQ